MVTILGGGVTNKVDELYWVGAATEVAVTVTLKLAVTDAGAVYVTAVEVALESVPHAEPAHPGPEMLHVTPLFAVSLVKLAVNLKV